MTSITTHFYPPFIQETLLFRLIQRFFAKTDLIIFAYFLHLFLTFTSMLNFTTSVFDSHFITQFNAVFAFDFVHVLYLNGLIADPAF